MNRSQIALDRICVLNVVNEEKKCTKFSGVGFHVGMTDTELKKAFKDSGYGDLLTGEEVLRFIKALPDYE